MRKVVVAEYVTLDGVMEDPAWTRPFWSGELAQFQYDQLFGSDALILGCVTYLGFAAAWPSMSDEQGFAARMKALPKYVASTTLDEAAWNATLIRDDVPAEVARLREQSGGDLLVYGSAQLVHPLMERGLIDAYKLMLYPVVLGHGKRLPQDGRQATQSLLDGRVHGTGIALLTYEPARSA